MRSACGAYPLFSTRRSSQNNTWQQMAERGGRWQDGQWERQALASISITMRASDHPPEERLESWKEIAAYLGKGVRTVVRWEKTEGLPVHRHLHERRSSVFCYR